MSAPTASSDTTKEPSAVVSGPEGNGVVSCVNTIKFGPHHPHAAPAENEIKLPADKIEFYRLICIPINRLESLELDQCPKIYEYVIFTCECQKVLI